MEELRDELEKVKRRRQEREREKAARDEEMALMQREKESEMFSVIYHFYKPNLYSEKSKFMFILYFKLFTQSYVDTLNF